MIPIFFMLYVAYYGYIILACLDSRYTNWAYPSEIFLLGLASLLLHVVTANAAAESEEARTQEGCQPQNIGAKIVLFFNKFFPIAFIVLSLFCALRIVKHILISHFLFENELITVTGIIYVVVSSIVVLYKKNPFLSSAFIVKALFFTSILWCVVGITSNERTKRNIYAFIKERQIFKNGIFYVPTYKDGGFYAQNSARKIEREVLFRIICCIKQMDKCSCLKTMSICSAPRKLSNFINDIPAELKRNGKLRMKKNGKIIDIDQDLFASQFLEVFLNKESDLISRSNHDEAWGEFPLRLSFR
jgi:hypothetical protein